MTEWLSMCVNTHTQTHTHTHTQNGEPETESSIFENCFKTEVALQTTGKRTNSSGLTGLSGVPKIGLLP